MIDFLSPGWGFVLYPLFGCCLSVLLTRVCIRVLPRLGYVDKPGGRHIHEHAVPRGGGIAVILAFFTALGFYALHSSLPESRELLARLLVPALLLGALMATAFFGMDVLLAVSPFLLIPEGILIGISFFKKAPS